jgi:hypothetical protein
MEGPVDESQPERRGDASDADASPAVSAYDIGNQIKN